MTAIRGRVTVTWVAVLVVSALLMIPGFSQAGDTVDGGLLVAFPSRLLHGALPHRDFYSPYGPGNVWTVGAAFKLFGASLGTERLVGMAYRLTIIIAAFLLALSWGLAEAVIAAGIVAALMVATLGANASVGFLALALLGFALLTRALLVSPRHRRKLLPVAGALLGAGLVMRYDFFLAVVLAPLPALLILPARERRLFVMGFIAGLAPLAIHVAIAGPDAFWRSVRIALGTHIHPARPPFASELAEFVTLYGLATVLLLGAGIALLRRARSDVEGRLLLGGGLWGLGLVPFALSHLDEAHVLISSLGVLAMLPVAATVLARGDVINRPAPQAARVYGLVAVVVVVFFAAANVIRGPIYVQAKQLLTGTRDRTYQVTNGGRSFKLDSPETARDMQAMIGALDRLARPRSSVFVGPQDLRTAGANDVALYFLLDRLRPASYFMLVDPHTINRPRNGFARELAGADFLVLTTRLTHFPLTDVGPPTPNEIVTRRFCVRAASGTYRLYQRCR